MKSQVLPLIVGLSLAVSGCGDKAASLPQGQVVATVDGKDITASQLSTEASKLGTSAIPNDGSQQQQALQQLIVRRLLVSEANKLGLDKTPQTAMLTNQAQETAIVEALAASYSKDVPKVSDDEAQEYVRANPSIFAQRKLLFADQLVVGNAPVGLEGELKPLHTLNEVEQLLKAKNIAYRHVGTVVDTAAIDPRQSAAVAAIRDNDIFFNRRGKAVEISAIITSRTVPLEGADATTVARNILTQQRTAGQVQQRLAEIVKGAKGRVLINPSYTGKKPADFK